MNAFIALTIRIIGMTLFLVRGILLLLNKVDWQGSLRSKPVLNRAQRLITRPIL